jgi:S-(hydroxymethyl)glutathione dehydrogenase/alcohol dehydrogenase
MQYGMTHGFNADKSGDLEREIRNVVGPDGADVVVDTTGNARVIEMAYNVTHPDGKTILVGVPRKGDNISIYSLPLHFKKILTGSHGGSSEPHVEIPRFIRLCKCGKMTLDGLITHEFGLDEINNAIGIVRSGEAGRVVIKMDHS